MDNQLIQDLLVIFICGLVFKEAEPIKITSIEIPRVVRAGTESTILDCKYDMESTSNAALVVKWYVNGEPLYQWIHGHPPRGSDEYRHYIDETYKASNDSNTMYRAVKLVRPGSELSGNVRCSISALEDEKDAEKLMLVYSPVGAFRLSHPMINEDSTQLTTTCLAEDLYPRPIIKLLRDNQQITDQKQSYKNQTNGRYSAEAVVNLWMNEIKLPTTFQCEVSIREANYTSVRTIVYNGGPQLDVSLLISFIIGILVARTTSYC